MERPIKIKSLNWDSIETILLDMDGTLLDLAFDNYFWLELIPTAYAEKHQLSAQEAESYLKQLYNEFHGTLEWYCIDFWSEKMGLDIAQLKQQVSEKVDYREGTIEFLESVRKLGKKIYLVTNAHPDTLRIKLQIRDFSSYFDELLSSHETGYPKEEQQFWHGIEEKWGFDKNKALFVDDSATILQAAQDFGIGNVVGVSHPDSSKEPIQFESFASVNQLTELLT